MKFDKHLHQYCWRACHIPKHYNNLNNQSRHLETSQDLWQDILLDDKTDSWIMSLYASPFSYSENWE